MIGKPTIHKPEGEWKWQWYGLDIHLSSELIFNALSLLKPTAFLVWLDLSMGLHPNPLTPQYYAKNYGISRNTYISALEQLEEKGFLVKSESRTIDFEFIPDANAKHADISVEVFDNWRAKQKEIIRISCDKSLTEEEKYELLEKLYSN